MHVTLSIDGYDRVLILLLLGKIEGSKFIEDILMNHYTLSLSEFEKRRKKDNSEYFNTTVSRKIVHDKIPFKMRVLTHAGEYSNTKTMHISLKIDGVTEYKMNYDLKYLLDREISKHLLGGEDV